MTTERERVLEEALRRIAKWFDEFPETRKFWENSDGSPSDRPMSYGAAYGSNGERDFMRKLAADALSSPLRPEGQAADLRTLAPGFRLDWSGLRTRFEEETLRLEKLTTYESRAAHLGEMARQFEDAVLAALSARPQPPQQPVAPEHSYCGFTPDQLAKLAFVVFYSGNLCAPENIAGVIKEVDTCGNDCEYVRGSHCSKEERGEFCPFSLAENLRDISLALYGPTDPSGYRSAVWGPRPLYAAPLAQPVATDQERRVICPDCKGTGDLGGNPSYGPCSRCGGTGEIASTAQPVATAGEREKLIDDLVSAAEEAE